MTLWQVIVVSLGGGLLGAVPTVLLLLAVERWRDRRDERRRDG